MSHSVYAYPNIKERQRRSQKGKLIFKYLLKVQCDSCTEEQIWKETRICRERKFFPVRNIRQQKCSPVVNSNVLPNLLSRVAYLYESHCTLVGVYCTYTKNLSMILYSASLDQVFEKRKKLHSQGEHNNSYN